MKELSEYLTKYKNLKGKNEKKIKIALLSSFTTKGLKEVLAVKCDQIGVNTDIYESNYNQYNQEILDEKSKLYSFEPQLVILFVDYQTISGNQDAYSLSEKDRKKFSKEKANELNSLVEKIKSNLSAKVVVHNFMVSSYSSLGILETKDGFSQTEMIQEINNDLRDSFKEDSQIFLLDYDSFCSEIGKNNIIDPRMYYLGDIKLSHTHFPALCDAYLSYIKPMLSLSRKCIVVDLDNILWGGIVGEDGIEGIKLGPTPEGRPFLEVQQFLLSLFNRGIILAVNSKNNEAEVLEVFKKHPHMTLKEEHFAAMQINWNDKATNIKAISEEINIGLDHIAFIDDDKMNRDLVKETYPEVLVVDMPEDPAIYLSTLQNLNDFNILQLTEDDKKKGSMYAAERSRKSFETKASDLSEYLKGLQMEVVISGASSFTIPRIAQLTQKTNQFNMTTRRYMEEDIKKMADDSNYLVVSISSKDKFGDNGIVGVAIAEKGEICRIDTFLMSCRVIGRRIEEALLAHICKEAKDAGAKKIVGEFIKTPKNDPAKDFYKKNNFALKETKEDIEMWEYDITNDFPFPDFIDIKNE